MWGDENSFLAIDYAEKVGPLLCLLGSERKKELKRCGVSSAALIPPRELPIVDPHTARGPTLNQRSLKVVVVKVEMRRKIWPTTQDSAGNRCLSPLLILESNPQIHFHRMSRPRIISPRRHDVQ